MNAPVLSIPSAPILRLYQVEAIDEVARLFASGFGRVLLVAPTGAGKTVMFGEIIRRMRLKGTRALFVAGARELIFQTCEKLRSIDVEHGIIMAGEPANPAAPVQVGSIQTLLRRAMPPADLVCVDEADLARAKSYESLLAYYPNAFVLGATGSPIRSDNKGLGTPFVGADGIARPMFERMVVAASTEQLMGEGHLVRADGWIFESVDTSDVKTRAGDFDEEELGRRATESEKGRKVIGDVVKEYLERAAGKRAVCFAVNVKHSKMMVDAFVAAGVRAEHVDGTMQTPQRDAIIGRLRSGETHVVCNVGILTRGVDIPAIEVVILARATKSLALYLQMVGRGLRTSPATGKTVCTILDHARCIQTHGFPDDPREWSLDTGVAPAKSDGEKAPAVRQCLNCYAAYSARKPSCPKCGWVPPLAEQKELLGEHAEARAISFAEARAGRKAGPNIGRVEQAYLDAKVLEGRRAGFNEGWAFHAFDRKFGRRPSEEQIAKANAAADSKFRGQAVAHQLALAGGAA